MRFISLNNAILDNNCKPDTFKHYVSVSPSLGWHDRYLLNHDKTFVNNVEQGKHNIIHSSLSLMVTENDSPQEVQDAQLLNNRLQQLSRFGLRSHYQLGSNKLNLTSINTYF